MTNPLALVVYETLFPGGQLPNRLQDLGYRVETAPLKLAAVEAGMAGKPLVVIVEVRTAAEANELLQEIKRTAPHMPILAYTSRKDPELIAAAQKAGATLVAVGDGVLAQLPHLLEQILQVD